MDNKFSEDNDFDDVLVGVGGVIVLFFCGHHPCFFLFSSLLFRVTLWKNKIYFIMYNVHTYINNSSNCLPW